MVYELSARKIKEEIKRLENLAEENISRFDKEGHLFNFTASLYLRTCLLAKEVGVFNTDYYVIRAENHYNCSMDNQFYDKYVRIYGILQAVAELEQAIITYSHKRKNTV